MSLGYRERKTVHAAVLGLAHVQSERYVRKLPSHAWEGPFRREGLLKRLINRIRRRKA